MPREYMCPQCARLVSPGDKTCDGCGADLRLTKPAVVPGTRTTLADRLQSPWTLYLAATVFFLLFAIVSRGTPALGRAYLWTLAAWMVIGIPAIHLTKLSEGWEEFIYYRPFRWTERDPLDSWYLVVILVGFQGLMIQWIVINPSMGGVSYWP
jgi:hypothetical protein